MDARSRALVTDFAFAAGAVLLGTLGFGGELAWTVVFAAVGLGVLVVALYLAEQTPILALVDEYSPLSLLLAFTVTLALGLILVVGWRVVASPAAALLLGMGVGLGGYRFVYR